MSRARQFDFALKRDVKISSQSPENFSWHRLMKFFVMISQLIKTDHFIAFEIPMADNFPTLALFSACWQINPGQNHVASVLFEFAFSGNLFQEFFSQKAANARHLLSATGADLPFGVAVVAEQVSILTLVDGCRVRDVVADVAFQIIFELLGQIGVCLVGVQLSVWYCLVDGWSH